ncbi:MAG TPA: DegT/DnrJ/EryC1/StrS family aminotransferase [Abditibacteriaceae bacterium]|nr:DegT/DnrJ/EryC1/StrS family aminotransferase [Abditibacteriaceae bacterium]
MTLTATEEKLALLGGAPLAGEVLSAPPWPPVSETVAKQLGEIYLSRNWSFNGAHEQAFARDFAAAHDARYGVFMANGTVTLQCALGAYGIAPGDEVIVPALTWPATAMAVLYLGATPVFVDVEPSTLCLDASAFEAAITPRTRAVIPVHLYGGMSDMEAVLAVAGRHNLIVVEDCAHGHGGKWKGRGLGSWGHAGSFSFQQSKTLACGEGGICLTDDEAIADRLYRSKHIGYADGAKQGASSSGPPSDLMCYNFRATEFQAAILRHQLLNLDDLMETYNQNAARFEAQLAAVPGLRVQSRGRLSTRQSYYAFCVVFDEDPLGDIPVATILDALRAEGLAAGTTYGTVYNHMLFTVPADKYCIAAGSCPVAEITGSQRTVVLPHQWLGADDATIEAIGAIFSKVAHNAEALSTHAVTQ